MSRNRSRSSKSWVRDQHQKKRRAVSKRRIKTRNRRQSIRQRQTLPPGVR